MKKYILEKFNQDGFIKKNFKFEKSKKFND